MQENNKTYVAVIDRHTLIVSFYDFDGELDEDEIEDKLSIWHDIHDIQWMFTYDPIDIFLNTTINKTEAIWQ